MMTDGKRERSAADMASMIERCLRAMVRRAEEGDIEVLAWLEGLAVVTKQSQSAAVATLLSEPNPYSWSDVANMLGITRQGAMRRFPSVTSGRTAGGQPAHLR